MAWSVSRPRAPGGHASHGRPAAPHGRARAAQALAVSPLPGQVIVAGLSRAVRSIGTADDVPNLRHLQRARIAPRRRWCREASQLEPYAACHSSSVGPTSVGPTLRTARSGRTFVTGRRVPLEVGGNDPTTWRPGPSAECNRPVRRRKARKPFRTVRTALTTRCLACLGRWVLGWLTASDSSSTRAWSDQ